MTYIILSVGHIITFYKRTKPQVPPATSGIKNQNLHYNPSWDFGPGVWNLRL